MKQPQLALAAILLLSVFARNAIAADDKSNMVSAGALVNPIGTVTSLAYERMVIPGMSLGGRFSSINYDYWDGSYNEWGSGSGVEFLVNYHFRRNGFDGPYIGVALGQLSVDWSWYQAGSRGYGTSNLTSLIATFGWDIPVGSGGFILRPSVILGSYAGAGKDNTGTKTSGVGAVAGAGIAASYAF